MSVNIFGSTGSKATKSDNRYVDKKFITLTTNLNTKMDKSGGSFTGDVDLGVNKITSSHVPVNEFDLVNKKYVSSLTPSEVSGISLNSKLNASGGEMSGPLIMGIHKVSSSHVPVHDSDLVNKKHLDEIAAHRLGDDDMRIIMNNLSLKVAKSGDNLTGNLNMGSNKITSSYVPTNPFDLVNKLYLDNRWTKNSVGYIPELMGNSNNGSGFIVSASSETAGFLAYHPFTGWRNAWVVTTKENMYLQIVTPRPVRVHSFALRGKNNNSDRILNWSLMASLDNNRWETLYEANNIPIGNVTQTFNVDIAKTTRALYYKLVVTSAEGNHPGLSYFQLFIYNDI